MEELSRRILIALLVGAAGPGAALLVAMVIGPSVVASATPDPGDSVVEGVTSGLVGVVLGGLVVFVVGYVAGAAATLFALRATRCPNAQVAWLVCLALSPMSIAFLSMLDLSATGFLVLLGVAPAAVRHAFAYAEEEVRSS